MKRILLLLTLVFFSFLSSNAQNPNRVSKWQLQSSHPVKAFEGTEWITPIKMDKKKLKHVSDRVQIAPPVAARYYFKKSIYDSLSAANDPLEYHLNKSNMISLNDELYLERAKDFMMKTTEVTNKEYKEFLNSIDSLQKMAMHPDTNCWQTDFSLAYNDPMKRYYFQHNAYEDYPVVGVSYYQAEAYCQWLENKLNTESKVNGYLIDVDLPNQYEWAFANGAGYNTWPITAGYQFGYEDNFYDYDYLTNLVLTIREGELGFLDRAFLPNFSNLNAGNFIDDGYMYTTSTATKKKLVSPVLKDKHQGIRFLNTNVSEWCKENYKDNWKDMYELRQEQLRSSGIESNILLADVEAYFNAKNDTATGQLVRGGNWVHEAHAFRNDRHVGTQSARIFINPNEQHSTVGFRYVIRLIPLEASQND